MEVPSQRSSSSTLRFLESKYKRTTTLNEKLLSTLKQHARSLNPSPNLREPEPLYQNAGSGIFTSKRSTQFKGRLASIAHLSATRNEAKHAGGPHILASSSTQHLGNIERMGSQPTVDLRRTSECVTTLLTE